MPGLATLCRVIQTSSVHVDFTSLRFGHHAFEGGWDDAFLLLVFRNFTSIQTKGIARDQQCGKASRRERVCGGSIGRCTSASLIGPSAFVVLSGSKKCNATNDGLLGHFDSKLIHGPKT